MLYFDGEDTDALKEREQALKEREQALRKGLPTGFGAGGGSKTCFDIIYLVDKSVLSFDARS